MNDAKRKDEYEPRLDLLATLIHDVWVLSLGAPAENTLNQDLRAQLAKIVSVLTGAALRAGSLKSSNIVAGWTSTSTARLRPTLCF